MLGRREDGYHRIDSVFLPLDLVDEVELEVAEAATTTLRLELAEAGPEVPAGEENLALRAARAFLAAAHVAAQVGIRLTKRVPAAAGLGGGSSDAGAVLRGLAERFPGSLAPDRLAEVAVGLGADVPFFLDPAPARVTGIGECREPLARPLPRLGLLLANPGRPLATAAVFAAFAAAPVHAGPLGPDLEAALARPDAAALGRLARNDLEPAARSLCPELAALRALLDASGALVTGLSGSGATLYAVFGSRAAAAAARERVAPELAPEAWLRVAEVRESR